MTRESVFFSEEMTFEPYSLYLCGIGEQAIDHERFKASRAKKATHKGRRTAPSYAASKGTAT